ncbi:hypothetical protein ABBQ32_003285 [Trebouxia sp. C0010 RCD-2024]
MSTGSLGSVRRVKLDAFQKSRQKSSRHWNVSKSSAQSSSQKLYLGLDFGTSGARAICIDEVGDVVHDTRTAYHNSELPWHHTWERALHELLQQTPAHRRACIAAIAVAATTTTSLLINRDNGEVLADTILYSEPQDECVTDAAQAIVPEDHSAGASVSSLCKLLFWHQQRAWQKARDEGGDPGLLHHADWLASLLHGRRTCSDWHNAARLGFDAAAGAYPAWLLKQDFAEVLPRDVLQPGCAVAPILPHLTQKWGLSPSCTVHAGTTDSVAAFLAAGVKQAGEAVSSLGSTLAIDLLSTRPIDTAKYGICSYHWKDQWIIDGGSNTGGAVLRQFFSTDQLQTLSKQIEASVSSGLDYYPLLGQGQRFPVNDPNMLPRMTPRPENDAHFLHGLLEGIAQIERESYELLTKLGATPVSKVYTAGGGAASQVWNDIRQQMLGVPVVRSLAAEAAYGAALLASQCDAANML